MEDMYLLIGAVVLLALQVLCFFTKKVWVRLIPTLTVAALMVFCVAMYAASDFTNWAYLILLFLLFGLVLLMGLAWLVYGIIRGMKTVKNHKL